MNFMELITGSDMSKCMETFATRIQVLPSEYQEAWEKIQIHLMEFSSFTGRNLIPILEGTLCMLEEAAAEGQSIQEVLGDDVKKFCQELAGEEGAKSLRDKWRAQLNRNVQKKFADIGKE